MSMSSWKARFGFFGTEYTEENCSANGKKLFVWKLRSGVESTWAFPNVNCINCATKPFFTRDVHKQSWKSWQNWLNWHCFFWSTDDDYNQSATSLPLYRRGVVMELRDVSQHYFYKYEHIQKCTLTNCFIKRRKSKSVDWGLNRCGKTRLKAAPCPLWRIQAPQGVGKASMSPQFLHMAISNFHSQYLRSISFHHNH